MVSPLFWCVSFGVPALLACVDVSKLLILRELYTRQYVELRPGILNTKLRLEKTHKSSCLFQIFNFFLSNRGADCWTATRNSWQLSTSICFPHEVCASLHKISKMPLALWQVQVHHHDHRHAQLLLLFVLLSQTMLGCQSCKEARV